MCVSYFVLRSRCSPNLRSSISSFRFFSSWMRSISSAPRDFDTMVLRPLIFSRMIVCMFRSCSDIGACPILWTMNGSIWMYKAVRCVTTNSMKFQRYMEASLRLFRRRIVRKIFGHSVLSSASKHIVIIFNAESERSSVKRRKGQSLNYFAKIRQAISDTKLTQKRDLIQC